MRKEGRGNHRNEILRVSNPIYLQVMAQEWVKEELWQVGIFPVSHVPPTFRWLQYLQNSTINHTAITRELGSLGARELGRSLGARELGRNLGARELGRSLGARELGRNLGAQEPRNEATIFLLHACQFVLCLDSSGIIFQNYLEGRKKALW